MRTLIVTAFVSLDGVMEAPGGEPGYRNAGWTFKDIEFDPAAYEIKGREQEEAAALLIGRVSYEAFAPVWPTMRGLRRLQRDAEVRRVDHPRGARTRAGRTTILRSLDDVAALKETEGGPIIVHGSATLGAQPRRRRARRPLPPAGLPGAARRRQAAVQRHRQGQADADVVESETYGNGITKLVADVNSAEAVRARADGDRVSKFLDNDAALIVMADKMAELKPRLRGWSMRGRSRSCWPPASC